MRKIAGEIVIPADCSSINGAAVLIEIRDVSRADALSTVVAQSRLNDVNIEPNGRIPFSLSVPEVSDAKSLNFRIHISCTGGNDIKSGDLLTTSSCPVPSRGSSGHVSVSVKRI